LVVQQIQHKGSDPRAVLHRRRDPVGESRACLRAAGGAAAAMRAVLGDDQRPRLRQIEHLPGDVIRRRRRAQRLAALGADSRIMVDRGIGGFGAAQRLARMARLTAARFTQAADPRRLLQSVAGWRFAAVAAVQPKTAFQLRQPRAQGCILGAQLRIFGPQRLNHRIAARRSRGVIARGCVVGRCH
jgi:hypothetical protein